MFHTSVPGFDVDASQCVILCLDNGNHVRFQEDTGAQCNVMPLDVYKRATQDFKLSHVKLGSQRITAYGGSEIKVTGQVRLRVSRGDFKCRLDCKLVNQRGIRPLLGRKACLGMKMPTWTMIS